MKRVIYNKKIRTKMEYLWHIIPRHTGQITLVLTGDNVKKVLIKFFLRKNSNILTD